MYTQPSKLGLHYISSYRPHWSVGRFGAGPLPLKADKTSSDQKSHPRVCFQHSLPGHFAWDPWAVASSFLASSSLMPSTGSAEWRVSSGAGGCASPSQYIWVGCRSDCPIELSHSALGTPLPCLPLHRCAEPLILYPKSCSCPQDQLQHLVLVH